jgi:hypothetical protein
MTASAELPVPPPVTNTTPAPAATGSEQQQVPGQMPFPGVSGQSPAPAPAAGGAPSWQQLPPPPPAWDTKSHIGATLLVVVHKVTHGVVTQYGVKSMVDTSVIELAGPAPGVYDDVPLYNAQLVGQLQGLVGQYTLGRLALGQGRGSILPIVLDPPTEDDGQKAQQWFNENPGLMEQLQRAGKLRADTPKLPPPGVMQQPAPMAGNQWGQSPTQAAPQQPQPWQQPATQVAHNDPPPF